MSSEPAALQPVSLVLGLAMLAPLAVAAGGVGLALRAELRVRVRMATAAGALFILLMLGACLLGTHSLHLMAGPIVAVLFFWGWMAAHPLAPLIGLLILGGLVLYTLPEPAARHWPWQVRALDVPVLGAWCLTFGVALLLSRREDELRRVRKTGWPRWSAPASSD